MRVRHILISYRVRLDGGRRWRDGHPPTSIRYALLREPTKGCDFSGMCEELSTEPWLSVIVRIARRADLNRWE
jgi:hypothetical protein